MDDKIIELYLSGVGSTTICKILNIPKKKILTIKVSSLKYKVLINLR